MTGSRTIWGLHHDGGLPFVEDEFVAIGWPAAGDLTDVPDDRDDVKAVLRGTYPGRGEPWIATAAGQLLRFRHTMRPGDLVVHPRKADRTINVGRVEGGYVYRPGERYPNRRAVAWLMTGLPREALSPGARHELGCSLTLFVVRRHAPELLAAVAAQHGATLDP